MKKLLTGGGCSSGARRPAAYIFFIFLLCAAACGAGAQRESVGSKARRRAARQEAPKGFQGRAGGAPRAARLEERAVGESSGVVASRRNPGVYWTHNDSGDGPYLYAFDGEGRRRGVWRVAGARALDWEDIAAGPGPRPGVTYLYVGDIGDNDRARDDLSVYRVPEPAVAPEDAASTRKQPRQTEPAEEMRVRYPDGAHNAEALLVHPSTGDLYIVVKTGEAAAGVYRLEARQHTQGVNTLTRVGEFRSPSPLGSIVTGGDISPDGRGVVLCDYLGAYELRPTDPARPFDAVWSQPPVNVFIGERDQGEAVCYRLDGAALLATSEGTPAALFEVELIKK